MLEEDILDKILKLFKENPKKVAELIAKTAEERYGTMPFIIQATLDKPEVLLSHALLTYFIQFKPKTLNPKTVELIAIAAAAALKAEYCLEVHIKRAIELGISPDEIFETILISSLMGLTSIEAIAFRKIVELKEGSCKAKKNCIL